MGIVTKHIGLADKFAVSASTVCAVHCVGLPFLLSVFLSLVRAPALRRGGSEVQRYIVALGGTIGFLSVLTATGGPFITLPLLHQFWPSTPPVEGVALGLATAIPISSCVAVVASFSSSSTLDAGLAASIAIAVALGAPLGTRLARQAKPEHLKLMIAFFLLVIGASAVVKTCAT